MSGFNGMRSVDDMWSLDEWMTWYRWITCDEWMNDMWSPTHITEETAKPQGHAFIHSSPIIRSLITGLRLISCHSFIQWSHVIHGSHVIHSAQVIHWCHAIHASTCHPLIACHWIMTFIHSSNDHMLSNHPCHSLITHHPLKTCYPNPANLDFFCFSRVRFVDLEQSLQRWVWMACLQWMRCDEWMTWMSG